MIIITLLFFSFIITKCFTSLLLKTYFKLIKVPYVDSLEQLVDGEYLIASMNFSFYSMEDNELIDEKQIEILRKMKVKYDEITNIDMETAMGTFDERIFNDVVDGRTILLEIGYRADAYLEYFKRDSDRFVVSQKNYVQYKNGHLINKRSSIVNQQIFGFVLFLIYPISLNHCTLGHIKTCTQ